MIPPWLFAIGLLAGIVVCLEIGRRVGLKALAFDPSGAQAGNGTIDTAVYGLLGLLLAFTFSGAATRFDGRRQLMAEETNAISTAYLRLEVLPVEAREPIKENFRAYVDSRIALYANNEIEGSARSKKLEDAIWSDAVAATRSSGGPNPLVVLPPINAMFDMATTQRVATETHPPTIIFVMLGGLALAAALLAGYGMAVAKERHSLHIVVFAIVLTGAAYVITDIEYPRLGLIRVRGADQVLIDYRATMK